MNQYIILQLKEKTNTILNQKYSHCSLQETSIMQKRCQWRTNGYVGMQTTKRLLKLCSKLLLSLYSPYESCSTSAQRQLRIKILGTHSDLLILSIPPTMGKQGFTNYLLEDIPTYTYSSCSSPKEALCLQNIQGKEKYAALLFYSFHVSKW